MPKDLIVTGEELWKSLLKRAGLTGKRGTRKGAYDSELIAHLQNRLFPGSTEPFERLLAGSDVSAEQLLRAFFATLRPFAEMKLDILRMLSEAGAQHSDDSLPLRFNFDPNGEPLDILLEDFARQMERLAEVIVEIPTRQLTLDTLWKLPLCGVEGRTVTSYRAPYPSGIPAGLREWLERYEKGPFSLLPNDWRTGHDYVDIRLERVVGVVNSILLSFLSTPR